MKENTTAFLRRLSQEFPSTSLKTAIYFWDAIQAKCPGIPEPSACFREDTGDEGCLGTIMFCWDTASNHLEIDCRGEVVEWFYLDLWTRETQGEEGLSDLTDALISKLSMIALMQLFGLDINKRA